MTRASLYFSHLSSTFALFKDTQSTMRFHTISYKKFAKIFESWIMCDWLERFSDILTKEDYWKEIGLFLGSFWIH